MFLSVFSFILKWYRIIKTFRDIVYELKRFTVLRQTKQVFWATAKKPKPGTSLQKEALSVKEDHCAEDPALGLQESVRSEVSRCSTAM